MGRNQLDGPGMGYGPPRAAAPGGVPRSTVVLAVVCVVLAVALAVVLLQRPAPADPAAATPTPSPTALTHTHANGLADAGWGDLARHRRHRAGR